MSCTSGKRDNMYTISIQKGINSVSVVETINGVIRTTNIPINDYELITAQFTYHNDENGGFTGVRLNGFNHKGEIILSLGHMTESGEDFDQTVTNYQYTKCTGNTEYFEFWN